MSKLLDEIGFNLDYITVLNKYDESKRLLFKVERRLKDCELVGVIRVLANDWVGALEDAKKYDLKILIAAFGNKKATELFNKTEYKVFKL